jgi:predicted membrane-bound spermidine synthase
MTAALSLVFFFSGASALAFETLWFHQAGLAFGNSVWASSLVLAGFMGGLAVGNGLAARRGHRVRDPLRAYAALEATIAVAGVALVLLLPGLGPAVARALAPLLDAPAPLNVLRFALAFALLLLPSAAMGATLPLLTQALAPARADFGHRLGWLYGWNTLGAVAGAIATEALAIGALGIRGTALAAGAVNLGAAAAALALAARRPARSPAPAAEPAARRAPGAALLGAALLSGFLLLALEVVWFRLLTLFVMEYSLSFSLMLGVVLTGIGLGGLGASAWLRVAPRAHRHAAALAWLAGAACAASYALSPRTLSLAGAALTEDPLGILRLGVPLMLPTAFLSGALFTLLGAALRARAGSAAAASGALALANTVGAAAGALAGGFVLLPLLGAERALFVLTVGYVGAGLAAFAAAPQRLAPAAAALALAAAALFPSGTLAGRHLPHALERWTRGGGARPVFVREGLTGTLVYLEHLAFDARPLWHRLVTNGYSMSSTASRNRRYMQLFAYLPVALRPEPRDALLISYGVGSTAGALVQTRSLERIDVVDVSREILEASSVVHPDRSSDPLADPRVAVHVEDGRYFLQTTRRRFDLVTGEPPPPRLAGVANLYTREYFALMPERLREGGVASYWLPLHSLSEASARSILRAFCDVFQDCSLWHGNHLDLVMLGSRGLRGPVPAEAFERQWRDPVVGAEMRSIGFERPEQLGALFIADAEQLRAWTRDAEPLVDDRPRRVLAPTAWPGRTPPEYAAWFDTEAARERFAASGFVAKLWPEALRRASLPYFAHQRAIDHATFAPLSLDRDIGALHAVLRETDLRSPVLWLLDSDADAQRAALETEGAAREHPEVLLHLAAGALAERRFADAAQILARAETRADGEHRRDAFRLRIYALCLAGRLDEAARLATSRYAERAPSSLPPFWAWLRDTFGVDPSRATVARRAGGERGA